jgi:hypothetical protein
MAKNIIRYLQDHYALPVVVTHPAAPDSGDPVRYGVFTGIALTDEGDGGNIATETTVYFGPVVADVSVKGIDDSSNSAVAVGDIITYTDADTPPLSKKSSGYFFGFAMETVGSGLTATIKVLKPASPGSGTLASGGVGATQLATGAVTAVKLSATLKTGFVPVPLTAVFEGDGTNTVAALGPSTTPVLDMTNGDTDSALRILWAATNVDPVIFQVPLPPDLDVTADVVLHLRAAMEAANDTPVIDADSYFNEGDTKVSDASAAITGATPAEYTITIAAADVPAGAQTLTVELTPAAHGTDDLYVYAIWIEYTRA